jgi:hypothetical protein
MWVSDLARFLGREFYWRYGKTHKSFNVLMAELLYPPPAMNDLPLLWQQPPQAMPDEYKHADSIIAYRRYYASKVATMPLVYGKGSRQQPLWLRDLLNEQMLEAA